MLQGMVLLLLFQVMGEGLTALFSLPVPGNVMGMGLMLLALLSGRIKAEWLPIIAGTVFSTFVVMAVTGWTEKLLDRHSEPDS